MAQFKKQKNESFESFLRRFKKGLKQSGRLFDARSKQYLSKKKTKRKQKESALISIKTRKKMEYLRKTGKISEEFGKNNKRR